MKKPNHNPVYNESIKVVLLEIIKAKGITKVSILNETSINIARFLNSKNSNDMLCSSLLKLLNYLQVGPSEFFAMVEHNVALKTNKDIQGPQ